MQTQNNDYLIFRGFDGEERKVEFMRTEQGVETFKSLQEPLSLILEEKPKRVLRVINNR